MNKAMSRVFVIMAVLFVALVVNLTWIMVVRAQWFQDRPENKRSIAKEMKIKRGDIVGYDGSVIAGTQRRSGYYYRDYPNGTIAPQLVGYDSVQYGRTGIEAQLNDALTGQSSDLGVQNWVDKLLGRQPKGASVKLTIVPGVQKVAQQQLQGRYIDVDAAVLRVIHHVQDEGHGLAQFQQLGAEVEVAFQVRCVEHVQDQVHLGRGQELHGHPFVLAAGGERIRARQVHHLHRGAPVLEGPTAAFHGDARPVAHMVPRPGQGVEQRGLPTVGIARESDGQGHPATGFTRMQELSSRRNDRW